MGYRRILSSAGKPDSSSSIGDAYPLLNRLFWPVTLFVALFCLGTFGYYSLSIINHNPNQPAPSLRLCIYQTSILLTGVGFSDVLSSEKTWSTMIFTVIMGFLGLSFIMYFISTITAFVVGGELSQILENKKMHKQIDALNNHFIVCGGGETGRHAVVELFNTKRPFVLIEMNTDRIDKLKDQGNILYLQADASDDDVLIAAGIKRAQGLISTLPEDKDNLLMVITARQLNPELRIVSRCVDLDNQKKLIKAGADSVVAPNMIGGMRMVSEMIRPATVTFLDTMLRDKRTIRFEDMRMPPNHELVGKTLAEANFPAIAEINVIATRENENSDFVYNPRGNLTITPNMDLVAVGTPEEIAKIRKRLEG